MRRDLRGQKILVTGASRGIGKCVALRLARLGARLLLTARTEADLAEVAAAAKSAGALVSAVSADVTTDDGRRKLLAAVRDTLGGLDVLVNNAGVASFGPFATSSESVLRHEFEVNFFAPAELCRLLVPLLSAGRQPAIVNMASICGRRGLPDWADHCASKFALVGLTEALAAEFARFGVAVLLLVPGLTRADDLGKHLLRHEGHLKLDFLGAQSADTVAAGLVGALQWNRRETVVGRLAWWLAFGQRVLPELVDYFVRRKYRRDCAGSV